jgi:probable O-glycosylation ligase (exosortase A-associated)
LVLWLYFTITTSVALNPDAAWIQWDKVSKILLMTFVTMAICKSRSRLEGLMLVIAVSMGLLGIKGGVFGLMTGGEFRVWGPPGGFMSDNNDFALALNMALPIIYYMGTVTPNKRLRMLLYGMSALTVVSIILTFSRGGFLGLAVVVLCFAVKNRAKLGRILALALLVLAAVPFIPESYWERISTIKSYDEDASAMGRINAWWTAYNIANARPFTGGGFETFTPAIFKDYAPNPNDFHDVHSVYFEILGEHGYAALFLYLLIVFLTIMTLWRIRRQVKTLMPFRDMRWAASYSHMLEISLYAFLTNGVSLGRAYFDLYYHVLAMAVLLHHVVKLEITSIISSLGGTSGALPRHQYAAPKQGARVT